MSAPVINLAAYRAADAAKRDAMREPKFTPSTYADNDFHQIGVELGVLAQCLRNVPTINDTAALVDILEKYAVNAIIACDNIRATETRIRKQERERAAKRASKAKGRARANA